MDRMDRMDRKAAEAHAVSLGAVISGSVSKKTSIVVWGPEAGSKYDTALALRDHGVRLMTEDEWWAFVEADATPTVAPEATLLLSP